MAQSFSRGIDVARIGACFMVVVLHVAAVEFDEFGQRWWASNFYDSFSRACVPVFLMITGVLLLNRQEELPVFLRKRFARILPPLVFWSLFYLSWYTAQGTDFGGLWGSVKTMISGPLAFHLWYLYALVGIYLFVPFMRHIWQASRRAEQGLYLAVWIAISAWPILQTLLGSQTDVLNTYELGTFFGLLGYLFLGAVVHRTLGRQISTPAYWWLSVVLFVVFSLVTMLATWAYSRQVGQPDPLFYDYLSPFVIGASVCAFNLLYGLGVTLSKRDGLSPQAWSALKYLATSTLGIYCAHIVILDLFKANTRVLQESGSAWWAIPFAAVVIFTVTGTLISVLRVIPAFRRIT